MRDRNLLADVALPLVFGIAAFVFAAGWLATDQLVLIAGALLSGAVAVYSLLRLRSLYLT
jgi:hypothetical protein